MTQTTSFTDIKQATWFDRVLPASAHPYARLARLDRPIGTWLLLLPCWWGVALAGNGWPDVWLMLLFALGAVVMRGAGCAINDIYDRDIDAQVERTRSRPLPSGAITLKEALLFLLALLLIGLGILLQFNLFTIELGAASLALIFTYPLMKRITWWPQLFLGFTFNWGALMGWSALHARLDPPALIMYVAGIFWTLGYDTIYAHQDIEDDARIGIKSTARRFGTYSRRFVIAFYVVTFSLLIATGFAAQLSHAYFIGLGFAVACAIFHLSHWKIDNPQDCLKRFRANRDIGLLVLAAIILGRVT